MAAKNSKWAVVPFRRGVRHNMLVRDANGEQFHIMGNMRFAVLTDARNNVLSVHRNVEAAKRAVRSRLTK
jgi:hypothetical protein